MSHGSASDDMIGSEVKLTCLISGFVFNKIVQEFDVLSRWEINFVSKILSMVVQIF